MEPCYSEVECKIIAEQIARRKKYRAEFLKLRTDPSMHAKESGYVFDPAMQKFLSMKATQLEFFKATPQSALRGFLMAVVPMVTFGYFVWNQRAEQEKLIREGKILYRDRAFKFQ